MSNFRFERCESVELEKNACALEGAKVYGKLFEEIGYLLVVIELCEIHTSK